jgi:hypothetical protein
MTARTFSVTVTAPQASTGDLLDANYASLALSPMTEKTETKGTRYTHTLIPTGGPSGQPCIEIAQLSALGQSDFGGQFVWGHDVVLASPPSSYFLRFRLRVNAPASGKTNFRGASWSAGGGVVRSRNKFIIVGGSPRWIINLDGRLSAETDNGQTFAAGQWNWEVIQDGSGPTLSPGYNTGTWYNVQMEIDNVGSPRIKIWMNNMVYASPVLTHTAAGGPSNPGYFGLGYFNNDGLQTDGQYTYRHADLEVGSTFSTTW